jgi:hypothetical protein
MVLEANPRRKSGPQADLVNTAINFPDDPVRLLSRAATSLLRPRARRQFTAFDGVIIAASMSSCAAKRSSLML